MGSDYFSLDLWVNTILYNFIFCRALYTSIQEPCGLYSPWGPGSSSTFPATTSPTPTFRPINIRKIVLSDSDEDEKDDVLEIQTDKVDVDNNKQDNLIDHIDYYNDLFRKHVMSINFN